MSKRLFVFCLIAVTLSVGCKRGRNISKGDQPVAPNTVEGISASLLKNDVNYQWLRIKTGITYETPDNSYAAAGQLKLHKNELLWGSVTMLIELVRAQVNKDSATFLDRAHKEYASFPVSDLQQMLAIEGLDIGALQRLLLARPPFGVNKESKVDQGEEQFIVQRTTPGFKEEMTLPESAHYLEKYRYEISYTDFLEVGYSDFKEVNGQDLPGKVVMNISRANTKMKITLDISDYAFLDTDEAPFSIPANYKRAK
jgi:hypothetical protein